MKKLVAGLVLGAGLGAGGYAGMDAMTDATFVSRQEVNAPIQRCAKGLGEVAITTDELPPGCERYDFKARVTQTVVERPGKPDKVTDKTREYSLPAREKYLKDNLVTKKEDEAVKRVGAWIVRGTGIMCALVGFWYGRELFDAIGAYRRKRRGGLDLDHDFATNKSSLAEERDNDFGIGQSDIDPGVPSYGGMENG